jgi:hypothetical protein
MHSLPYNRQNRELELIPTPAPRRTLIDAAAARRLLAGTARLLEYASESSDSRELLAGLDLIRKAPGMLPNLEVRPQ